MRNRKAALPIGHPRRYTSKGTFQVSQEKRIQHAQDLIEAATKKAEREAAAVIAAAQAQAAAAREEAVALESHWQEFNDSNLAAAVRQRDAALWRATIHEDAYKGLHLTTKRSLAYAGRLIEANKQASSLLRNAGSAAGRLLSSDYKEDGKLDLDAALRLSDLKKEYEPLARMACNARPLHAGFRRLNEIDKMMSRRST